jgi:hypothetical protein
MKNKAIILMLPFFLAFLYKGHAQTTVKGTVINQGSNVVEVYGSPNNSNLTNIQFETIIITLSLTDQGASNPALTSIIPTSLVSNLTAAYITSPDSFVTGGRVYYTFFLNDNSNAINTTWTANASNPIASFQFPVDPATFNLRLDDQSTGGIGSGGGATGTSFWYVSVISGTIDNGVSPGNGDVTNYPTMFYGTGATNNATVIPSFVPLQASDPLPVKFVTFTATLQNDDAFLSWTVSNESAITKYYAVQKSMDGGHTYSTIDTVFITKPNATSNTYSYTDADLSLVKAASNTIYYRIKQVDGNGVFTYSATDIIQLPSKPDPTVTVYPNPVQDFAKIKFTLDEDALVTINLSDINGRVLQSQQIQGTTGENIPTINMSSLVNGNYILTLHIGSVVHTFPLVKAN